MKRSRSGFIFYCFFTTSFPIFWAVEWLRKPLQDPFSDITESSATDGVSFVSSCVFRMLLFHHYIYLYISHSLLLSFLSLLLYEISFQRKLGRGEDESRQFLLPRSQTLSWSAPNFLAGLLSLFAGPFLWGRTKTTQFLAILTRYLISSTHFIRSSCNECY